MKSTKSYYPISGLSLVLFLAGFSQVSQAQQNVAKPASTDAKEEMGNAVFYSDKLIGRPLTSGEKYDQNALTAAHRTLPLGTKVRVTNLKNNKSVVVRTNDRGPHGPKGDIIDLSGRGAEELDLLNAGRAKVKLEVVDAAPKK